jgi:ribosomal protein S18 acetylase RimI-like enzyme
MSSTVDTGFRVGAEIRVPSPPRIPGFRFRLYRGPEDHPGMIAANNTAREAADIVERVTVDGMDNDYANLHNSDRYRDVIIGELDGRIRAYGRIEWGDNTDGARDYTSFCLVEPSVRRAGVGAAMLAWQEARIREIASRHVTDRPRFYFAFVYDGDPGGLALLSSSGYEVVRRGAEMVRPTLADIPVVAMPDGLALRRASTADARAVWDAATEIFRDHWGAVDESDESFASFVGNPKTDPSLWVVACDGDEIAGEVLASITDGVGYLDSVGVRRPWRRRGLGRALVAESLRLLAARGATSVGLGVDLQNQNEAARLYESVGFEIRTTSTEFRKPLIVDSAD